MVGRRNITYARKNVYMMGHNGNDSLSVLKRQRPEESSEEEDNNGTSKKAMPISLKELDDPLLRELEAETSSDQETSPKTLKKPASKKEPSVELIQNLDVKDIEQAKKDRLRKKISTTSLASLLPTCLDHVADVSMPKDKLRQYYMNEYHLPPILLLNNLLTKVQSHINIINDILKGKIESPFYYEAKLAHKRSDKAFLSMQEFRQLDLKKFQAGYYGLKRQLRVGDYIHKRFENKLTKSKSHTLKWWGSRDFANYILAPEVLVSLCMDEMHIKTRLQAYDILANTVEFGLEVADTEPLEEWELSLNAFKAQKKPQ